MIVQTVVKQPRATESDASQTRDPDEINNQDL